MNPTILVTGGSRGIGAATALLAARKKYNVCINYLKNHEAALAVADTINKNGGRAITCQADVSSEVEVKAMFGKIDQHFGGITALVNNAGILETQSRVENMDTERLMRVLSSNVLSCFLCSREAIKRMSTKLGGSGALS